LPSRSRVSCPECGGRAAGGGREEPFPYALAQRRVGRDPSQAVAVEQDLDELAEPIQPSPQDVIGSPGALEEAAEVVDRIARHLVLEADRAEALGRVTRADADGLDDVLLVHPTHRLEGKEHRVEPVEVLIGLPHEVGGLRYEVIEDVLLVLPEPVQEALPVRERPGVELPTLLRVDDALREPAQLLAEALERIAAVAARAEPALSSPLALGDVCRGEHRGR
jgi:hypothetical protein